MDEDQISYDAILRIVDNGLEDTKKIVYDTLSNACANNDLHERREVRYMVLQGLLSDDWSKNEYIRLYIAQIYVMMRNEATDSQRWGVENVRRLDQDLRGVFLERLNAKQEENAPSSGLRQLVFADDTMARTAFDGNTDMGHIYDEIKTYPERVVDHLSIRKSMGRKQFQTKYPDLEYIPDEGFKNLFIHDLVHENEMIESQARLKREKNRKKNQGRKASKKAKKEAKFAQEFTVEDVARFFPRALNFGSHKASATEADRLAGLPVPQALMERFKEFEDDLKRLDDNSSED